MGGKVTRAAVGGAATIMALGLFGGIAIEHLWFQGHRTTVNARYGEPSAKFSTTVTALESKPSATPQESGSPWIALIARMKRSTGARRSLYG